MANVLSPSPKQQFLDNNGRPAVGYLLFTYEAGTSTKLATYVSESGSANSNPIELDYRGECDLWIPPNVSYKYVLARPDDTDPPTAPIWSVDDVVSSQIITLYGGVDTGSADAYVLDFAANFTAYTDGILIYWLPTSTNTGPSTINVNGLGAVNIVNQAGDALGGNEIVANQIAAIMYLGGQFVLLTATTSSGTFTPAWSGFSSSPSGDMAYQIAGRLVTLQWLGNTGTSNATFMSIGNLPFNLRPTTKSLVGMAACVVVDNNTRVIGSLGHGTLGTLQFNMGSPLSGTGFTNSGTKGLDPGWTCSYLLS